MSIATARTIVADVDKALKHVLAELKRRVPDDAPATYARLQLQQGELAALRDALREKITGKLTDTLDGVARTTGNATLSAMPVGFNTVEVPVEALVASAKRPFDGKPWSSWGEKLADDTIGRLESELRQSVALGETMAEVTKRVAHVADLSRTSAARLARTSVMATSNTAMVNTYRALGVTRVRFTATLDGATSLLCASLDGTEHLIAEAPTPPLHPNCRSVLIALLDDDDLTGERAAEGGPVPVNQTFEGWLRKQPASFQREYLGDARYAAWKSGLDLGAMSNTQRALSLDELRRLYPDKVAA